MKKVFFLFSLLSAAALFSSCSNEEGGANPVQNTKPKTTVFFQGQQLFPVGSEEPAGVRAFSEMLTRAEGLKWPYHTDEGWESARFSIRADNGVVDFYDKPSVQYFGRVPGRDGRNRGKVSNLYNYSHYNDRDYDYYKVDKKTGENIGLFRYLYDENGLKTQPVILEAPKVEDILADEVDDLNAAIAAGKDVDNNTAKLNRVNELLDLGSEYLNSHIRWYVVKEVASRYYWHVNGVLGEDPVPPYIVDPVPDDVEVDVHQQVHETWDEIKTSIHIRTDCESVKVIIPLKEQDILEQDDFNIRIFNFYYKEYTINHTITHDANGITIEITNIPADMIEQLKHEFGDGITIEIHSYCTGDVWEQLKNSRVQTGKPCNVDGQISTALQPTVEGVNPRPIYVEKSN